LLKQQQQDDPPCVVQVPDEDGARDDGAEGENRVLVCDDVTTGRTFDHPPEPETFVTTTVLDGHGAEEEEGHNEGTVVFVELISSG
jgi:hypothetical protein